MTAERQIEIAKSFTTKYEEFEIGLTLSAEEFNLFEKGIFAKDMDSKWNIFVIEDFMYWARSWTGFCIYKVKLQRNGDSIKLLKAYISREGSQYRSISIENDRILFLKLTQIYLHRDDIYVDPEFELPLVKAILEKYDPSNNCIRSIGRGNNVGLTRKLNQNVTQSQDYLRTGWEELEKSLSTKDEKEDLLTLYIQNNQTKTSITFFFETDGKEFLGQITTVRLK